MSKEPTKLLRSQDFVRSIKNSLPEHLQVPAMNIRNHLIGGAILADDGTFCLKGTSPLDLGFLLLIIEELDEKATTVIMCEAMRVSILTIKNWIDRLRSVDYLCDVDWLKKDGRVKGNIGKYVVSDWGIINREVYLPFKPYVKLVIDPLLAVIEKRQAKEKEEAAKAKAAKAKTARKPQKSGARKTTNDAASPTSA